MTKEQLLASLKPLEWKEYLFPYAEIFNKMQIEIIPSNNQYILEIFGYYESINCGSYNDVESAKDAAQHHYNNLVLTLFNLDE